MNDNRCHTSQFRPVIGITMGDPAGIGAEICLKALMHQDLFKISKPLIIGDYLPIHDATVFLNSQLKIHCIEKPEEAYGEYGTIDLIDLKTLKKGSWEYKTVSAQAGKSAFQYIITGINLAISKAIDAVVTGPISKASIHLAGHHYSGHTEIFAQLTHTKDYAMLLMTPALRVIHVTTHVSMLGACRQITRDRVHAVIRLAEQAMRELGIENPQIGVAGFNPHCSENGLFGHEEEKEIIPAIKQAEAEGIHVEGPIPADTVFVKAVAGQYDIVVAMYHDQGHIPMKLLGFKMDPATKRFSSIQGVNVTIGLPIIRTSVDHGTAFDKAGEGSANEESLKDAIEIAASMATNRLKMSVDT